MMASAGARGGESRAKAKPKAKTGGGSFWKLAAAVLCCVQVRTDATTLSLCTPQGGQILLEHGVNKQPWRC
jgi:hypothetical protein